MVTAGTSPACSTRWMSEAAKVNASPAAATRLTVPPPSTSRSSRTAPATTPTAPPERSWSWNPVSWSSIQQMSQTATCSSRTSSS